MSLLVAALKICEQEAFLVHIYIFDLVAHLKCSHENLWMQNVFKIAKLILFFNHNLNL